MNSKNIKLLVLSEKLYRAQKLLNAPTISYYHKLRNQYGKRFLKEEFVYKELLPEKMLQNKRLIDNILDSMLDQKDQSNYLLTIEGNALIFSSPTIKRKISFYKYLIHIEVTNYELTSSVYKDKEMKTISFLNEDMVLVSTFTKQNREEKENIVKHSIQQFYISDLRRTGSSKQKVSRKYGIDKK